jgi:hypothetical protein
MQPARLRQEWRNAPRKTASRMRNHLPLIASLANRPEKKFFQRPIPRERCQPESRSLRNVAGKFRQMFLFVGGKFADAFSNQPQRVDLRQQTLLQTQPVRP